MRVICNNAKSCIRRVLLHDTSERHLRRARHGIRLVEDDQLECRQAGRVLGGGYRAEDLLGGGEGLDLLAHDVDAAVVGGVEFEHHLPHVLDAVDVPGEGEDGGGLACAWGTIEEKMG